jgi:hypothetical protein
VCNRDRSEYKKYLEYFSENCKDICDCGCDEKVTGEHKDKGRHKKIRLNRRVSSGNSQLNNDCELARKS